MKSFGILRTNPGLTTNVKVVVDSKYGLSLDSINSVPELSNTKFKKFDFNKDNYYDELLPYFFDGFPIELAYNIKYDSDADTMSTNFADSFDEIYQYGARNILENKNYDEEFEYFAPLYIYKNKLPKNFIIFRVDGPGLTSVNRQNFKSLVLSNLKTVKIFDLTKKTVLGEWLDLNIDDNEFFPDTPLEMNYQRLEFSKWNGIDFRSGGFVSKSFFLDDVLEKEMEIFEMERLIFDGYRKNGVVFPNILNLSFLFDDTPATQTTLRKWSINRYYGFYLDDIEKSASISPYVPPKLKSGVTILKDNILNHTEGVPFTDGWSDAMPFYVELEGEYYKIEKFIVKQEKSVKPISTNTNTQKKKETSFPSKSGSVQVSSASLVDVNNPSTTNYVKDEKTDTYVDKWRIISQTDLKGKESMLNANTGYISEEGVLLRYSGEYFTIEGFDRSDVWIIEIDGKYHNLITDGTKIMLSTDYTFEFGNDFYRYYVNNIDTTYTQIVYTRVDTNTLPKQFAIYKLKFTDIKDFDTRIVDTEPSKFEYEKEFELTDTEESKLYLQNLNTQTYPKLLDDFYYGGKVVNVPVSSEYTANNETFKINGGELSPIWRKNPVYCRWEFEGSLSANDYPYVLNNSSTFEEHNRTANTFEVNPIRLERNLDYFYTINSSSNTYVHHTLHLEKSDSNGIDRQFDFSHNSYLGTKTIISGTGVSKNLDYDYFDSVFKLKSGFNNNKLVKNTKKYSEFIKGDSNTPNYTVFRGIKFAIYDVKNIKFDSSGRIEIINTTTRNTFEDYKFSVILTSSDNGMQWDVIDKWELGKSYKRGDLVEHHDIIYRAIRDTTCTTPRISVGVKNVRLIDVSVKPCPYKMVAYTQNDSSPLNLLRFDTNVVDPLSNNTFKDSNESKCNDWVYYEEIRDANIRNVFWSPLKAFKPYGVSGAYVNEDVVYNNGNFYIYRNFNGTIDFWNPVTAYAQNESEFTSLSVRVGYGEGAIVFFKGAFYMSDLENNINSPDGSGWIKVPDAYSQFKWQPVGIWTPNRQYNGDGIRTYILHNDVLYKSVDTKQIPSGENPSKSTRWQRVYSMVPDTDLAYTYTKNPIIRQNGEYYRIVTNTTGVTLDNGIKIFINHKYKNVLVNIYINDNTITGLKNVDRDSLYNSLSKKLVAKNFIDYINNPMLKNGFSDYIKYHIINSDGTQTEHRFDQNIESLKHIIFAEHPDLIKVKTNSLIHIEKNESKIKPTKYLNDGKINTPDQIDYFNNTHMAVEIVENVERQNIYDKYYNLHNKIFRFSGNYMPIFYDVELFNTDNSVEYNRMHIILEISSTQNVRFIFEYNGTTRESIHQLAPSGSFSTSLDYHSQILNILTAEFPDIEFSGELLPKTKVNTKTDETFSLNENYYDEITNRWYGTSRGEGYARIISATSSPTFHRTDIFPGNRFKFYGDSTLVSIMQTSYIGLALSSDGTLNRSEQTFEFVLKSSDVTTYNAFMGDGINWFGFEAGRAFMKNRFSDGNDYAVYSTATLEPNVWYHLTFTYYYDFVLKRNITRVFVDGLDRTSKETLSLTHTLNTYVQSRIVFSTTNTFIIGAKEDYTNNTKPYTGVFNGYISSMRFIDRALNESEVRSNFISEHQTLLVKYRSREGDLKLTLKTDEPRLYLDFYDMMDPGYAFYTLELGATGGNPPYEFSYNGSAFSPTTSYSTIPKGTTLYIVVKDSIGITASNGKYLVNTNTDSPFDFLSPLVY